MRKNENDVKVMRPGQVAKKLGIGLSTFWRWKNLPDFPMGIKMGGGRTCWIEHEIDEWILSRERVS